MNASNVTKAVSQLLNTLYPTKIVNDFHEYLEDEEYDSEVLKDDLKDEAPFFVEYIISQNAVTFHNQTQKQELIVNVKKVLNLENDEKYNNDNDDNDKWRCIYIQLKDDYLNREQCNTYYAAIIEIIKKKQFDIDDVLDDLNGFSEINNDSIIAECIIAKFGWNQNEINTIRLITCLKHALCKKNEWKQRIATIIGLRDDDKSKYNMKYDLFAKALNVFNDYELCALFRLYIRQKMIKSAADAADMIDMNMIIKFIYYRFPKKSQKFNDEDFLKIFKIGFCNKFIGHNSILNKLNKKYHILIDIRNVQCWLVAIVMKMNQYFRKYETCHSIFCIRFLPQLIYINNDNHNHNEDNLYTKIEKAFKMLEDIEINKSDYCWTFIIDLNSISISNEPEIYFESIELYDDEIICGEEYNKKYSQNQFYHLKKLDYLVCKRNDNITRMALQVSFHKYKNNKMENQCVSWLTHSSGHIPFFESDIISVIPKLFKKCDNAIQADEWQQIIDNNKIMPLKCMDATYCELEQSYINFMKLH